MRRTSLLTILPTLLLLVPATASAGVASVEDIVTDTKYGGSTPTLFFTAGAGERNRLTLGRLADASGDFVLRDGAAAVRAGPGCRAADPATVICDAATAYLDAGDGADSVTVGDINGAFVFVRGGDGDDTLSGAGSLAGGAGRDVLSAGEQRGQHLAGGSGDDVLRGGDGNDELSGDGSGPAWPAGHDDGVAPTDAGGGDDVLAGGAGTDKATYAGRDSSVRVDLTAGRVTGEGGERDRLTGIEDAAGGDAPDLLLGDAGPNQLEGGAGGDRIDGRGGGDYLLGNVYPDLNEYSPTFTPAEHGVDTLRGGTGADRLDAGGERRDRMFGGPGNDEFEAETNYGTTIAQTIRCGTGADTLHFAPAGQLLADCEDVDFANERAGVALHPVRRGGALRFAVTCTRSAAFEGACKVVLRVHRRSSLVASGRASIPQESQRGVRLRMRRPLSRGTVLDVAMTVQGWTGVPARTASWRVRLR